MQNLRSIVVTGNCKIMLPFPLRYLHSRFVLHITWCDSWKQRPILVNVAYFENCLSCDIRKPHFVPENLFLSTFRWKGERKNPRHYQKKKKKVLDISQFCYNKPSSEYSKGKQRRNKNKHHNTFVTNASHISLNVFLILSF